MLFNTQEMLRRRIEHNVELQHAIELQGQRMANIELMDLKHQQPNNPLPPRFRGGISIPSPRQSHFINENVASSNPDALQGSDISSDLHYYYFFLVISESPRNSYSHKLCCYLLQSLTTGKKHQKLLKPMMRIRSLKKLSVYLITTFAMVIETSIQLTMTLILMKGTQCFSWLCISLPGNEKSNYVSLYKYPAWIPVLKFQFLFKYTFTWFCYVWHGSSLEHILPDTLFASPTKSAAEHHSSFSLASSEADNPPINTSL